MPGMPGRRTHDHFRHGVTSLFAAFDITTGQVISELHRRHRAIEFKKFLTTIDKNVPDELDVHIVCDNYATHKTDAINDWPGVITDKLIRRGVHTSVQALEADIRNWINTYNEDPRPFQWTKTADEILNSLQQYLTRISGATH